MLEHLKKCNPNLSIYSVDSKEFEPYGRVIQGYDVIEILRTAEQMEMPKEGSMYYPSVEAFEALPIAQEMKDMLFGEMPTQVGYCYGHSSFLNAVEWHTSNEINIAVAPFVLILGKITDLKDNILDSSVMKAFYVPSGTMLEVYSTTLHFCPCEVEKSGFGCVVALPTGTNTPLQKESKDKRLFRTNKWLLAHQENEPLKEKGVVPGIFGENFEIKY